jgi:ectoine hydroxylase-related dioxygenase (phytanoyl-CoA dioxygenase family)
MEITRHRWNTSFTWDPHPGPYRVVTPEQAAQFDDRGYTVVPDLLSADDLERTVKEVDALEAKVEAFLQEQENTRAGIAESGAITFTTHIVARSDWLRSLVSSDPFTGICHDLLGPDVRLYWDQAVYKKPEKPRRFPWHQDNGYTFVEPQQYLTVWLALTDATVENGCPQVAPGLHKHGTLRHYWVDPLGFECFSEPGEVAVAAVKAGGAVVFSSLTPHLTGPNTTASSRKAYIVQYAPEGAVALRGDTKQPPAEREPCTNPEWQFPVLAGGESV